MYILEASLEYLISILVAGAYFAKMTEAIGISDEITGILLSIISLGNLFQLGSLFIRPKRVKSFVVTMSVANQLLFMSLYLIPGISISTNIKTILFVGGILLAYILYNLAHPKKINWLMSLVEDENRGRFTSVKEMVSLIMGIAFTLGMGKVIDHFEEKAELLKKTGLVAEAKEQMQIAFMICAATILGIMVLHTITMMLSVEKKAVKAKEKKSSVFSVLKDKTILKIGLIFAFYYMANSVTTPFYATYQNKELDFSMFFIAALGFLGSGVRIAFSFFWGAFADKRGFSVMLRLCMVFLGVAYLTNVFTVPANGKIFFALYTIFNGIAMAGCNSALINLVYDYVEKERRADAIAVTHAISGVVGFLTTLAVSPLVAYIQEKGGLFGLPIYAQQVTSFLAVLCCGGTILYITVVFGKKKAK